MGHEDSPRGDGTRFAKAFTDVVPDVAVEGRHCDERPRTCGSPREISRETWQIVHLTTAPATSGRSERLRNRVIQVLGLAQLHLDAVDKECRRTLNAHPIAVCDIRLDLCEVFVRNLDVKLLFKLLQSFSSCFFAFENYSRTKTANKKLLW